MPKSKRSKVVALTKVKSKGRSGKEQLVDSVREGMDKFKNAFIISFENMRAGPFKTLAHNMREDSRFFLGKNKVIQVALGKTPEDEHADNTHLLSKYMRGQVALLLTNKGKEELEKHLAENEGVEDFATAGTKAAYTVFLQKGKEAFDGFTYSMEQ